MRAPLRPCLLALPLMLLACAPDRESHTTAQAHPLPVTAVDCAAGTGSLTGRFVAPNGSTPVVGATITVSTAGGCTATSNKLGFFAFTGLPAGATVITAAKGNFVVVRDASADGAHYILAIPADSVSLAYVPGLYDSIQTVLTRLGFQPSQLTEAQLSTADLTAYDAIFLNCGLDESYIAASTAALQSYVTGGGTLYASDWAGTYVDGVFPGYVNFVGKVGDSTAVPVTADVLDPTFVEVLGKSTANIQFDLDVWMVIDSAGAGATTLLTGPATWSGATVTKPFAEQFPYGAGRVTYTSFHNEAQATSDMQLLLESIVFAL